MARHGDLSKPIRNARGRIVAIQHWQELTSLLNSDGSGDTKTTEKWKKVFMVISDPSHNMYNGTLFIALSIYLLTRWTNL